MGNESKVSLRSAQKRDVYLTGFGAFSDVDDNPTARIVEQLTADENVSAAVVLQVAPEESMEALQPLRKKAEESGRPFVFLHLGLNVLSNKFSLERVGYNELLLDHVTSERIIARDDVDVLHTALPLDEILTTLREDTERVDISTDTGRYLCNYVFFQSLY